MILFKRGASYFSSHFTFFGGGGVDAGNNDFHKAKLNNAQEDFSDITTRGGKCGFSSSAGLERGLFENTPRQRSQGQKKQWKGCNENSTFKQLRCSA